MQKRWIALIVLVVLCGLAVWSAYMFLTPIRGQWDPGCNYDENGNLIWGDPVKCRIYKCGDPDVPDCGEGRLAYAYGNPYIIRDRGEGESCVTGNYSVGPLPQPRCCKDGVMITNGGYTEQCAGQWDSPPSGLYCEADYSLSQFGDKGYCRYPQTGSSSSSRPPVCGNGTKEGTEECDAGSNNVPLDVANKEWEEVGPDDEDILSRTNCLEDCTIAECGNGEDDDDNGVEDGGDSACRNGPMGDGSVVLRAYNKENHNQCEQKQEGKSLDPSQTANLLGQSALLAANTPVEETDGPQWKNTFTGEEYCIRDSDCGPGPDGPYRCAYYTTEGGEAKFRCRKMIKDGEVGCRHFKDCMDNKTGENAQGIYKYLDHVDAGNIEFGDAEWQAGFAKCIGGGTGVRGQCCDRDTDQCKRIKYVAQPITLAQPPPQCPNQQPFPPFPPGFTAGSDGGDDSGDGSGDGISGDGGSASSSAASSVSSCSNTNTCAAIVKNGNNYAWIMPASCPLTGNKRTCYSQCLAGIGPGATFTSCESRCNVSESDLGMCPCSPDYDECAFSCAVTRQQCNSDCNAFGSGNDACLSACLNTASSCILSCGRRCVISSAASSVAQLVQSSTTSQGSSGGENSAGSTGGASNSSSARSTSSTPTSSASQNSTGSNQSAASSNKSGASSSTVCLKGDVCIDHFDCVAQGGVSKDPGFCGVSPNGKERFCCQLPASRSSTSTSTSKSTSTSVSSGGSSHSRSSSISSASSTSSVTLQGVCCEQGNCNPFGTCSNPFQNYNACKAACGSSSSRSSSRSSVASASFASSSVSSLSRTSSSASSSVSSASRSSSMTSSSRPSSQSSTRSTSSGQGSAGSNGNTIGGENSGDTAGIDGIGGDISGNTSSTITGNTSSNAFNFSSSGFAGEDACLTDADCTPGFRCILNHCLSPVQLAQLPDFCGNARIDAGEICDNGADNSTAQNAYCRPDCTLGRCGDAILDTPLELCDDGNMIDGDGCSAQCQVERGAPTTTLPGQVIELPFGDDGGQGSGIGDTSGGSGTKDPSGSGVPSTPNTGPAALAIMIAGGAAGWLYRRKKY
jgi:cysteine-rich repeat protein